MFDRFDSAQLTTAEKRLIQTALASTGIYHGRIDGNWDAPTQDAIEKYATEEFGEPAQNLHAAALVIELLAIVEDQGWAYRGFAHLDYSLAVPAAVLDLPEKENDGQRWWSSTGSLTMLTNTLDQDLVHAWHAAAMMANIEPESRESIRGDESLITGGLLEDGRVFYTRSDRTKTGWSTVYLASGPDQAYLLNLIRSGISTGDPIYWELPEGGFLEGLVSETLQIFEDPQEDEADFDFFAPSQASLPPSANADASGTGFYVGPRILVTAEHVIQECERIALADGTELVLLAHNQDLDVAALASPVDAASWLSLTDRKQTRLGQKLHAAGFPYYNIAGTSLHLTGGNVSSLADVNDDRRFFSFTAPVQPGNSGGPLLDRNGKVMGVVVSRLSERFIAEATGTLPQNINYALNRSALMGFLDGNRIEAGKDAIGGFDMDDGVPDGFESAVVPIVCR